MTEKSLGLVYTLLAFALVLSLATIFMVATASPEVTVDDQLTEAQVKNIVNTAVSNIKVDVPQSNLSVTYDGDAEKLNYLYDKEHEEDSIEEKAFELATEVVSLDDNDFREAVYDALVLYGIYIDDEDDITKIKVLDSEVNVNNVTFSVKVYYFIDGDEEETARALLKDFTITVDDCDPDEDFEDAEYNEDYLDDIEVMKVYS